MMDKQSSLTLFLPKSGMAGRIKTRIPQLLRLTISATIY